MGNIIPKISLGSSSKKRYTRRADFDNNTTMEFGYIQPLFSKLLEDLSDLPLCPALLLVGYLLIVK